MEDHEVESYVRPTHCEKCGKLLPGQPIWMVIPRGQEDKYICNCLYRIPVRPFYSW